jgi:hypothetical protein
MSALSSFRSCRVAATRQLEKADIDPWPSGPSERTMRAIGPNEPARLPTARPAAARVPPNLKKRTSIRAVRPSERTMRATEPNEPAWLPTARAAAARVSPNLKKRTSIRAVRPSERTRRGPSERSSRPGCRPPANAAARVPPNLKKRTSIRGRPGRSSGPDAGHRNDRAGRSSGSDADALAAGSCARRLEKADIDPWPPGPWPPGRPLAANLRESLVASLSPPGSHAAALAEPLGAKLQPRLSRRELLARLLIGGRQEGHPQRARGRGAAVDAVRGLDEVGGGGGVDAGHEALRVAVDEGEPG